MSVNPAVLDQWRRARRPVLSVLLGASWLLLQQSVDPGNLITAIVLGWGLPRLVGGFMGPAARPRAWVRAVRLVITVTRDIVVSNITVAKLVLDPRRQPQPAWVKVPLTLEEPLARALLASIITMTPGTVSAVVDEEAAVIWVHALDCDNPQAVADDIDARYQQALKEILG
ncbi:MAG: Na+/H+ antiporter subunit E [Aquabacterium sp.]|jgi:multicomponent K+:H+ antiporter subunit E